MNLQRFLYSVFVFLVAVALTDVCYAGMGESAGKTTGEVWHKAKTTTEETVDKVKDAYNRNAPKVEKAIEEGAKKVGDTIKKGVEKVKKEAKDFSTSFQGTQESRRSGSEPEAQ